MKAPKKLSSKQISKIITKAVREVFAHRHRWKTTHTNPWQHATKQECRCGLTRSFEYKPVKVKGPLWKQGQWAWSNGTKSEYGNERHN